jgi:hypothetical protein
MRHQVDRQADAGAGLRLPDVQRAGAPDRARQAQDVALPLADPFVQQVGGAKPAMAAARSAPRSSPAGASEVLPVSLILQRVLTLQYGAEATLGGSRIRRVFLSAFLLYRLAPDQRQQCPDRQQHRNAPLHNTRRAQRLAFAQ